MVRVRCVVVPILVLAVSLSLTAASNPPVELHQVGDHWTAYDPPDPATFPEGSKVHIIKQGDTLWDLANSYYGNPYLWPQLWETNTYIRDAHWIYPGDPLVVQGEVAVADVATESAVGNTESETVPEESAPILSASPADTAGAPIALGTEADLYCWGYLGAVNEPVKAWIASVEDVDLKYVRGALIQDNEVATDDIIFIAGGTNQGIIPGETYLVVRPGELVEYPSREDLVGQHEIIGQHYDYRGQVRILCATETSATAIVIQACAGMRIGDRIDPLPQLPIPLSRQTPMQTVCDPGSGKATGVIVNAKDGKYALGVGTLVEVNLGSNHNLQPGDFLTVFRPNVVAGMPDQILGEIGVLTTLPTTATGRITRMRYQMNIGNNVEIK